jgi:MOSC domain-containing protein YiiM
MRFGQKALSGEYLRRAHLQEWLWGGRIRWVTLKVGDKAVITVTERDPRCKMITIDPNTAEANPEIMRRVARAHDGKAGVYGAVLVEGTVRPGDQIALLS